MNPLVLILLVILLLILLGGIGGPYLGTWQYGYGLGHSGIGIVGLIILVILVMMVLGRF
jgi:hypothetical protein